MLRNRWSPPLRSEELRGVSRWTRRPTAGDQETSTGIEGFWQNHCLWRVRIGLRSAVPLRQRDADFVLQEAARYCCGSTDASLPALTRSSRRFQGDTRGATR